MKRWFIRMDSAQSFENEKSKQTIGGWWRWKSLKRSCNVRLKYRSLKLTSPLQVGIRCHQWRCRHLAVFTINVLARRTPQASSQFKRRMCACWCVSRFNALVGFQPQAHRDIYSQASARNFSILFCPCAQLTCVARSRLRHLQTLSFTYCTILSPPSAPPPPELLSSCASRAAR